jgi:4-hydroxybenzoate polyprenyltransferase
MTGETSTASDIPRGGIFERHVPEGLKPYGRLSRLDRPIGTWLLLFPCLWSVLMATGGWPTAETLLFLILFSIGAVVMRGAGCTYNDIVDRDFDGRVARTADRPIPSGAVSVKGAVAYLIFQCLVGFIILLSFNGTAIMLGVASLLLVFTYPLMKRVTYWPQFFLGLAFNWGALMGWAAVRDDLALWPLIMYAAGICWTLGYDTIYAHQDKEDDVLIGVKSTALRFGSASRTWISGFYIATILLLLIAAHGAGYGYWSLALIIAGGAQLAWQVKTLDFDDPAECLAKFKSNRLFGWLVFAAFAIPAAL